MKENIKKEVEKFKDVLKQHIGETKTIDQLLQKVIENGINLVLIDCQSRSIFLHEPNESDCLI